MDELIKKCKCGIYLEINEHKDSYTQIEKAIKNINEIGILNGEKETISEKLAKEMVEKDRIISLQFYPDTPIGSYQIYGTEYREVIKEALEILKENK